MLSVGIINVKRDMVTSGVPTFIHNFAKALKEAGYEVRVLDFASTPVSVLNKFDILHFSDHYLGVHSWKLLFLTHPKKVLTVHGCIKRETWRAISRDPLPLRVKSGAVLRLILWHFVSILFDEITSPSERAARECPLKKAMVINNGIFPEEYSDISPISVKTKPKQVVFVTYSSGAGNRDLAVVRVINVVSMLNQMLGSGSVMLLIFGDPPPTTIKMNCENSPIRFLGRTQRPVFLRFLKGSDLFIDGTTFPDLGYTQMESGALGIPNAKFTNDYNYEELEENRTGILARTDEEMMQKLSAYVINLESLKPKLGLALRDHVLEVRRWSAIIPIWANLFNDITQKRHNNSDL